MKPVTLKGEWIVLRPLRMSDAKTFLPMVNDPDINRFMGNMNPPISLKKETEFVRKAIKDWKKGEYIFAVEHKSLKRVIGCCGLHVDKTNSRASFGLWIAKEFWHQGYGKEMAKLAIGSGFKKFKLNRVEYTLDVRNKASKALIKSLGGKLEGRRRKYTKKRGKYYDDLVYSILRSEWKSG